MQRRLTDVELKDVSKAEAEIRQLAVDGLIHLQDPLLQTLTRMLINGTTDGLPYVEPPLTDEDARARPWVAVWDERQNNIPNIQRLVHVAEALEYRFSVANSCGSVTRWKNCRRATLEEIAAAGLEVAE
jgi:hypothetical protein